MRIGAAYLGAIGAGIFFGRWVWGELGVFAGGNGWWRLWDFVKNILRRISEYEGYEMSEILRSVRGKIVCLSLVRGNVRSPYKSFDAQSGTCLGCQPGVGVSDC